MFPWRENRYLVQFWMTYYVLEWFVTKPKYYNHISCRFSVAMTVLLRRVNPIRWDFLKQPNGKCNAERIGSSLYPNTQLKLELGIRPDAVVVVFFCIKSPYGGFALNIVVYTQLLALYMLTKQNLDFRTLQPRCQMFSYLKMQWMGRKLQRPQAWNVFYIRIQRFLFRMRNSCRFCSHFVFYDIKCNVCDFIFLLLHYVWVICIL